MHYTFVGTLQNYHPYVESIVTGYMLWLRMFQAGRYTAIKITENFVNKQPTDAKNSQQMFYVKTMQYKSSSGKNM